MLGEEISNGRDLSGHLAISQFPRLLHIVLGSESLALLDVEESYPVGVFPGLGDGLVGAFHPLGGRSNQVEFHVGLAAAEPHFPDEDIIQENIPLLPGGDQDRIRASGLRGVQFNLPTAFSVSLGGVLAPVPGGDHRDLLAGRRPAPDRGGSLTLKDHMVGEHAGHLNHTRHRIDVVEFILHDILDGWGGTRRGQEGRDKQESLHGKPGLEKKADPELDLAAVDLQ